MSVSYNHSTHDTSVTVPISRIGYIETHLLRRLLSFGFAPDAVLTATVMWGFLLSLGYPLTLTATVLSLRATATVERATLLPTSLRILYGPMLMVMWWQYTFQPSGIWCFIAATSVS